MGLLLYRFDSNTKLEDITSDVEAQQILQKKETKDVWEKLTIRGGGGREARFAKQDARGTAGRRNDGHTGANPEML